MVEAEFDSHSAHYRDQHQASINFGGIELDYFAEYKAQVARAICLKRGLAPSTIMDFGSGIGNAVRPLRSAFPEAHIKCVDVSEESLRQCSALNVEKSSAHLYDGTLIPFADKSIDLAFTACVFHHIPAEDHVRLLTEIRRCLSPQGVLVLFEHNPLNPLTQLAVARCPFDENAVLINSWTMQKRFLEAGFSSASSRFRIFFPGFLKALRGLENLLEPIPFGGQYYVTGSV